MSPTQPASGLNVLFLFQRQSVNISRRYITKHQRRVGGIQPKPYAERSSKRKAFQIDNHLRVPARDRDAKDGGVVQISQDIGNL